MQINETNSYTEYTTTEPTTDFVVGFEYFNNNSIDIVNITVDNTDAVTAGYTVSKVSDSVFRLTPAVPSGSTVRLSRETTLDAPIYKFSEGALFRAPNVDANFKQLLHAQQEVRDTFDKLDQDTARRLDGFYDDVQEVRAEFVLVTDVANLAYTTATVANANANTALTAANAIDNKATTALSNSTTALSTANAIDAKATDALDNALAASLDATTALTTANAIDAKATTALSTANTANNTANTAITVANGVDAKATSALNIANTADANATSASTLANSALKQASNLSDLPNKPRARTNLDVYSTAQVNAAITAAIPPETPDATETTAGKAKIATTAIAQAGTNDTDIITAKKLRDALNASGNTPVYALRAKGRVTIPSTTIDNLGNIKSITRVSQALYEVEFLTEMPDTSYCILYNAVNFASGQTGQAIDAKTDPLFAQTTTKFRFIVITTSTGGLTEPNNAKVTFGVF